MQAANKSTRLETMDMEVHPLDQDVPPAQKGTVLDDHDMQRMGKIQELKVCRPNVAPLPRSKSPSMLTFLDQRNMRPVAALSFASILQATWEFILM